MDPNEALMNRLGVAAGEAATEGLTFGETAAAVLQLGLKMAERHLGKEQTVVLLRRIASEMSGPTPLNVVEIFKRD